MTGRALDTVCAMMLLVARRQQTGCLERVLSCMAVGASPRRSRVLRQPRSRASFLTDRGTRLLRVRLRRVNAALI